MTDNKKRRMSMLDGLTASGAQAPVAGASPNRALKAARDAVDSHRVWELDPAQIEDNRPADRLDPQDVLDLRQSIEANGQTVPILVRRHPTDSDRYELVYGRRRLEAIRGSEKVERVRALIATMDETAALRAQVTENTARRDLSYIERALFAHELLDNGFGSQTKIAEVLNTTRSAVSMAITISRSIGHRLARAIGPAPDVGRPRWELLSQFSPAERPDLPKLVDLAEQVRSATSAKSAEDDSPVAEGDADLSNKAFDAVLKHLERQQSLARPRPDQGKSGRKPLSLNGKTVGEIHRTTKGIQINLSEDQNGFIGWLEDNAQAVIDELHARWAGK